MTSPLHIATPDIQSSKGAFHPCRSHSCKFLSHNILFFLLGCLTTSLGKGRLNAVLLAEVPVVGAGIACVATDFLYIHSEKPLVQLRAVHQSCIFVEGIERQLLYERQAVDKDVVALGAEFHALHFLSPDNRPHIRLVDAYYPVRDSLPVIIATEVVVLLPVHRGDYLQVLRLSDSKQVGRSFMLPFHLPYLLQYLVQQLKLPSCNLSCLTFRVLALLPVCQIRLLNIKVLGPGTVETRDLPHLAHYGVCFLYPLS